MKTLIKRNIMLYYRDRTSVFFSLLSVIIVLTLYILFLAELQITSVESSAQQFASTTEIKQLVHSWILAGLLTIVPITSSLGALVNVVADRERKIIKDFKSSPLSIGKYPIAAIISSCIIGMIMSVITVIIYSIYIYISVDYTFTAYQYFMCFGLSILVTIMATSINALLVSFLSTISAFTSASIVIGTVVGFITGVYVPMGILPQGVQDFIKLLPFGHAAVLFRDILMKDTLNTVFGNVPVENLNEYKKMFGITFDFKDKIISSNASIIYIVVVSFVCLGLFILNYNRKKKEI